MNSRHDKFAIAPVRFNGAMGLFRADFLKEPDFSRALTKELSKNFFRVGVFGVWEFLLIELIKLCAHD
jgi:hypothetical protein